MPNDIEIKINGIPFLNWNELTVTREIDSIAGSFDLNFVQDDPKRWPLSCGDSINISTPYGSLLTGFIDHIGPDLDSTERSIYVTGRDNTCDIIDCTYPGRKTEFNEQPVDKIVEEIIKPFNITLKNELRTPVISSLKIDPGEKIWESLQTLSKKKGLVFQPSGNGELIISKHVTNRSGVRIEEGFEILDCYANFDHSEVYSEYIVKAMDKKNKPIKVKAVDQSVTRNRPLEIISDTKLSIDEAQKLANWERDQRSSKTLEVSVTVQGWRHRETPWKPNTIITVHSPSINVVEAEMLIKSVCFTFDAEGTTTSLGLSMPDSYQVKPFNNKMNQKIDLKKFNYVK